MKLVARDVADLEVVSSILQDALVPVSDIAWLTDEHRFVMAVNRFRWEREGAKSRRDRDERVVTGVTFENVARVQRRNFDAAGRGGFLNLLSVSLLATSEPGESVGATVLLTFAGDAAIRLESAPLLCHLEDIGEPWPTQWRPDHS
ncbi:MAG: DUF2948 family protein [Alphaproteobacteria bacterium]|jgi:hypothetical protein